MTCVVGYKSKDGKLYFGGDRIAVSGYHVDFRSRPKIFKNNGILLGYTTSFRMGDILEYVFNPPVYNKSIASNEFEYMIQHFIPELIKCFGENNWLEKKNEVVIGGTFLVGVNDKLFYVDSDFQVGESADNYYSIGAGRDIANGAMYALRDEDDAERKLTIAIEAATRHSTVVGGGIDIIS